MLACHHNAFRKVVVSNICIGNEQTKIDIILLSIINVTNKWSIWKWIAKDHKIRQMFAQVSIVLPIAH